MNIDVLIEQGLLSTKHAAIYDYLFQTNLRDAPWYEWLDQHGYFECKNEYIETIQKWIHSSTLNVVYGIERFEYKDMIIGTTQTFDEAYYEYAGRTLRVFRGEYAYHARAFNDVLFLDDNHGNYIGFEPDDWCIISIPFCGNGSTHEHMNEMLDEAQVLGIPVIVDCAWFGTCRDMDFDFSHPAITSVSFSLSKGIGMGNMRSGIRYSHSHNRNLPIAQQNTYNHLMLVAAQLGIHQMNAFKPDFIATKYHDAYLKMCKEIGLVSTNCMHIAMAPKDELWNQFLIDGLYRKVGVRQLVKDFYSENIIL